MVRDGRFADTVAMLPAGLEPGSRLETFMATHVLGPDPKVELVGTTLLHQLG